MGSSSRQSSSFGVIREAVFNTYSIPHIPLLVTLFLFRKLKCFMKITHIDDLEHMSRR